MQILRKLRRDASQAQEVFNTELTEFLSYTERIRIFFSQAKKVKRGAL